MLRVGDKVMQVRNNYDKAVFNGDVGWVRSINKDNTSLKVEFLEESGPLLVKYEFHELDELVTVAGCAVGPRAARHRAHGRRPEPR